MATTTSEPNNHFQAMILDATSLEFDTIPQSALGIREEPSIVEAHRFYDILRAANTPV
jgi:hypothetical protein